MVKPYKRVKPLFHHLQFLTSGHSVLRAERQSAWMSKIINCCTHMATVGIKGLTQPECGLTVGSGLAFGWLDGMETNYVMWGMTLNCTDDTHHAIRSCVCIAGTEYQRTGLLRWYCIQYRSVCCTYANWFHCMNIHICISCIYPIGLYI